MEALFTCVGGVFVFFGLFGIVISRSYLISLFLCLEVIVIGLFCLLVRSSFFFEGVGGYSFVVLRLLAVKACEASAGLALTVAFSRSHGNTLLSSGNLLVS